MHVEQSPYTDKDLLAFLGEQESQHVRWGDGYADELLDRVRHGHIIRGTRLPWRRTHDNLRLRTGEVTVWAGINGHYKSMLVGQVMLWCALQGERVGIASFEMPVIDTQERMLRQAAGTRFPSESFSKTWSAWNRDRICYYDKLDTTRSDVVLGAIFHMAKDKKCQHIMVDSLMKCGLPYGERGAEKDFIDALCATAKAFRIHIHLVCHVRKPASGGEEYIPTKFDVRGAGELTDLVHNVIICWADKKKAALRQAKRILTPAEVEYMERPDQRLIVAKQRNGAYEGTVGLWAHDSLQFTEQEGRALPFSISDMEGEA